MRSRPRSWKSFGRRLNDPPRSRGGGSPKGWRRGVGALHAAADRVRIFSSSALALPRADPFDLIFADPPYAEGSGSAVVKAVADANWLAPGGWMSVETSRADTVDPDGFTLEVTRDIGRARLTLLRRP